MKYYHTHQMDITKAFPHANSNESRYMHAIPGYRLERNEVIKLNNPFYILKQSPMELNILVNVYNIT